MSDRAADPYGRWSELLAEPEVLLIPLPEISSRDPHHFAVPKTARALAVLAAANRWRVRVTYARGPRIHSTTGRVTRIADTVAVRMRRDDQIAFAFWTAGKFEAPAIAWTFGKAPELLGAEPIKNYLKISYEGDRL